MKKKRAKAVKTVEVCVTRCLCCPGISVYIDGTRVTESKYGESKIIFEQNVPIENFAHLTRSPARKERKT